MKSDAPSRPPPRAPSLPDLRPLPSSWSEPPWDAPFDAVALVQAIPSFATMTGVFLQAVVDKARASGAHLSGRDHYVAFRPYPLREHATLLVDAARALWPGEPLRNALRRLGRGAPAALVHSIIGRVVLGSVDGPDAMLRAMARSYAIHTSPGDVEVVTVARGQAVVRMREIHHFVDCHHVGVFEGVLASRRSATGACASTATRGPTPICCASGPAPEEAAPCGGRT